MRRHDIRTMHNGWFIGHFTPAVLTSPHFEVAHHALPKGYRGPRHFHAQAVELNYLVRGRVRANGEELTAGEFFVYEKGEVCDVEILEDTDLVVVKMPSVPGDKHPVD